MPLAKQLNYIICWVWLILRTLGPVPREMTLHLKKIYVGYLIIWDKTLLVIHIYSGITNCNFEKSTFNKMYYSASILNFFYNSPSMLKAGLKPTILGGGGQNRNLSISPPHIHKHVQVGGNFSILYYTFMNHQYFSKTFLQHSIHKRL